MTTNTKHGSGCNFLDDAPVVIGRLKDAFAEVVRELPGDIERANQLSQVLGVSTKVGWQVTRLLYESDPFIAAQYVPKESSAGKFLAAAAGLKVDARVIAAAEEAIGEFDRLVQTHAESRESFDMLAASCAARVPENSHVDYRKASFVGNSFTWGVHARVQLASAFMFPAEDASRLNLLSVRGFAQLRRLRPDISWPIHTSCLVTEDGSTESVPNRTPIDPTDEADPAAAVPLLRKFSTHSRADMRRVFLPDHVVRDELLGGRVGKQGVVDCFLGEVVWNLPGRYATDENRTWAVGARVRTPCEVLIIDQFVHRGLFGPVSPRVHILNDLVEGARMSHGQHLADVIHVGERIEFLGRGLSGIRTPEMPQYVDLANYVTKHVGLDGDMFDTYRVRIEFPPLPSTVAVSLDLPAAPGTR